MATDEQVEELAVWMHSQYLRTGNPAYPMAWEEFPAADREAYRQVAGRLLNNPPKVLLRYLKTLA